VTYREIWEKACAEGKGGMEDGRPWVGHNAGAVMGCENNDGTKCVYDTPGTECGRRCLEAYYAGKFFFWPSNEPLPETEKMEAVNQ
jgi:hypothetical protein